MSTSDEDDSGGKGGGGAAKVIEVSAASTMAKDNVYVGEEGILWDRGCGARKQCCQVHKIKIAKGLNLARFGQNRLKICLQKSTGLMRIKIRQIS